LSKLAMMLRHVINDYYGSHWLLRLLQRGIAPKCQRLLRWCKRDAGWPEQSLTGRSSWSTYIFSDTATGLLSFAPLKLNLTLILTLTVILTVLNPNFCRCTVGWFGMLVALAATVLPWL